LLDQVYAERTGGAGPNIPSWIQGRNDIGRMRTGIPSGRTIRTRPSESLIER
jgi:hypothetical protein